VPRAVTACELTGRVGCRLGAGERKAERQDEKKCRREGKRRDELMSDRAWSYKIIEYRRKGGETKRSQV